MKKLTGNEVLKKLETIPFSRWQRVFFSFETKISKYRIELYQISIGEPGCSILIFSGEDNVLASLNGDYGRMENLYLKLDQHFKKKEAVELDEKIDRFRQREEKESVALKKAFAL